jgi:uncharacterized membrane protein YgaE (UPF0421/DUF939 family)
MFELERHALQRVFQLPRPSWRETLALAAVYAAQAVICTLLLFEIFHRRNAHLEGWAIISAIIVLQPGIEASLAASIARICSNTLGAAIALLAAWLLGRGMPSIIASLVVTVLICELARLDMGLRAGCVSVIIVMMFGDGRVVTSGIDRTVSVIVGSALAVIVQIAGTRLKHLIVDRLSPPAGAADV